MLPFVVCNGLQALPHPMSIRAGIVRFGLSPVLTFSLYDGSSEGIAGFLISFRVRVRVSPIFLCRSSQALSGWMGSVAAQLSSGLSRDRVQVRALAGPLNHIQKLVPKPLLHDLGCVLRIVVLLEGKNSTQSEVLRALG